MIIDNYFPKVLYFLTISLRLVGIVANVSNVDFSRYAVLLYKTKATPQKTNAMLP